MPPSSNVSKSALELEKPKTWREVKDGKNIPPEELPMQTAAPTGRRVYDYEFDILFDDGVYRSWLGNAVPLFENARRATLSTHQARQESSKSGGCGSAPLGRSSLVGAHQAGGLIVSRRAHGSRLFRRRTGKRVYRTSS